VAELMRKPSSARSEAQPSEDQSMVTRKAVR
jgi:hypothetical protein